MNNRTSGRAVSQPASTGPLDGPVNNQMSAKNGESAARSDLGTEALETGGTDAGPQMIRTPRRRKKERRRVDAWPSSLIGICSFVYSIVRLSLLATIYPFIYPSARPPIHPSSKLFILQCNRSSECVSLLFSPLQRIRKSSFCSIVVRIPERPTDRQTGVPEGLKEAGRTSGRALLPAFINTTDNIRP